ncbi:MAG TPA: sugar phosphate nucleotidyltransferase [Acidimicrobiales bacterium]|nr:sugar phosphate nucleotidyltransferase [Acidimicrobiales bacterium]
MKAVIMAGGEGTRLRPLTTSQPKPMLPMANRPMAEHIVALLRAHGFDEIVMTVAFLANTIRTYFGDGSEFGVRISYATEQTPLGTAGSVLNAREVLDDRFLVISGDVLTDIDLTELVAFHERSGAVATLALKSMENPLEFGIVITDEKGRIERFLEKPGWGQVFSDTINTGIYVLEPEVLDFIAPGRPVDFSAEVFPLLLGAGRPIYGCRTERYWEDVGTLEAYLRAHEDVLDGKVALGIEGFPLRPGVWVGTGAEVDPTATIVGPALIGDNCRVGPGARVGAYSVLGANVRVGDGAEIERSVVHDNCYVGAGSMLRGVVVGRSSELRQGVHIEEGAVIGDHCRIGRQAVVTPGVKIYPHKLVEANATVTSSIIWESRASRALFGRLGLVGLANVDLSPELAVRVALAYASMLPKGATVTTSRDSSRAARVLKRAAMVGLNAAGLNVEDLEAASMPVTRFHVRTGSSQGGVSVRLVADDPQSVVIRFLDAQGLDIDEATQRKIERIFYREEARRVLAGEIGDIDFPPRTVELYTASLLADVDAEAIRRARFKLVLDYAYGTSSLVMPSVLAKLGAEVLAVNPLVSTEGLLGFERWAHAERLAELVRSSGAHLGAVIGADGEQLTLVDDSGRVLRDAEALLGFARLVGSSITGAKLAVPVNATWRLNELCADLGAEVVWTKLGTSNLLELAATTDADLAADTAGGFAFPCFLPALDAVAALVHLLELLARSDVRLSDVVACLPPVWIVEEDVHTPFDHKGSVMRAVLEQARGDDVVLVDGVKVIDAAGWTLVVPDPEEPLTHVFAEGDSADAARARAGRAVAAIEALLGEL